MKYILKTKNWGLWQQSAWLKKNKEPPFQPLLTSIPTFTLNRQDTLLEPLSQGHALSLSKRSLSLSFKVSNSKSPWCPKPAIRSVDNPFLMDIETKGFWREDRFQFSIKSSFLTRRRASLPGASSLAPQSSHQSYPW